MRAELTQWGRRIHQLRKSSEELKVAKEKQKNTLKTSENGL